MKPFCTRPSVERMVADSSLCKLSGASGEVLIVSPEPEENRTYSRSIVYAYIYTKIGSPTSRLNG